jgi:heme/copper-type cytochrome/quinol oxidase subunit 2|tara:strand:+ start:293 stop:493 length:201 start_codon:yes stop_codon:yes gene_type:complete
MEIIIILIVLLVFAYFIYKVAKSKNREPAGWILAGVILSPIIILIILALMPSLPGKKKGIKKRKKS